MRTPLSRVPADLSLEQLYEILRPITTPSASPRAVFTNWAQTYRCVPLLTFVPDNEEQCALVLELARREGKTVRVAGVGHSPSDLACTTEFMLRTDKMDRVLEVNPEKKFIVVQGGITLHALHARLEDHGLCMMNCGSISEQSLAGVVSTATHGSGLTYGVLSTHVQAMTLLLADGSRVRCSRRENSDLFIASLCGLGTTGLILTIQLEVEPAFNLIEYQETSDFEDTVQRLPQLVASAEHVRFWWFPQSDEVRFSSANRTQEPIKPAGSWLWGVFCAYHLVQFLLFVGRWFLIVNTWTSRFAAWAIRGKSVGIDRSYKIFNVDCRYPQYTTEWAIPYENTQKCLRDLRDMYQHEFSDPNGLRPHFPVEIRFSEEDDIWLSPSSGQRTCWLGIVQYKPYGFIVPYRKIFSLYEDVVMRHGGRPHWAKAHPLGPNELRQLYPHFDDFVRVLNQVDPHGMFRNPYVQRHIFGSNAPDVESRAFKTHPAKRLP